MEVSYILAELFNSVWRSPVFQIVGRFYQFAPIFNNVWESSTAKSYRPVSLLSVVGQVFEKLVNNRIVDHLGKCGLFSDFQFVFRSSQSTADLLTVASDRIASAFNRSVATWAVTLDISKAFDKVWHTGLLCKLKSYRISGQYLALLLLFSVISGFEWFLMGSLHKSILLMLEFLKAPFRLQHMTRAIACACLCTHPKHYRCEKKSMPCLIKKASRCAADHMSKTTTFFIFRFYKIQRSYEKIMCICYLIGSVVKIVLYLYFLYTKDERLQQIKKKHEWWNNCFSYVFTYCLNLKTFASLFFLIQDNFMF